MRLVLISVIKNYMMYIHQSKEWPNFISDNNILIPYVSKVLDALTRDIVKSSEFKGELLDSGDGGRSTNYILNYPDFQRPL
jgi:hypothetical protein